MVFHNDALQNKSRLELFGVCHTQRVNRALCEIGGQCPSQDKIYFLQIFVWNSLKNKTLNDWVSQKELTSFRDIFDSAGDVEGSAEWLGLIPNANVQHNIQSRAHPLRVVGETHPWVVQPDLENE